MLLLTLFLVACSDTGSSDSDTGKPGVDTGDSFVDTQDTVVDSGESGDTGETADTTDTTGTADSDTGVVDTDTGGDTDTWETGDTGETGDTDTGPADVDGDGYTADVDCDDFHDFIHPDAAETCNDLDDNCDGNIDEGVLFTYYLDGDGDGFGVDDTTTEDCFPPTGYAVMSGDCDDADTAYHPGATETDCTDPNDYNCDGATRYDDTDGDGYAACEDCNDSDATINPLGVEVCDGFDNNCDLAIDEGLLVPEWPDVDGDGYGSGTATYACEVGSGYAGNMQDCDDAVAAVNPDATEVCDEVDNDCNTKVDDDDLGIDHSTQTAWFVDADGDTYGGGTPTLACVAPSGSIATGGDCDDTNAAVFPGATEVCNDDVDDDCNGRADEADVGTVDLLTLFTDGDADGYGGGAPTLGCTVAEGQSTTGGDCNDTNAEINPAAAELCDRFDNDCDLLLDDDDPDISGQGTWYPDGDGDLYGDSTAAVTACFAAPGEVGRGGDCDDTNAAAYPGATEICDGFDDDCDTLIDDADPSTTGKLPYYTDGDGDTFGSGSATYACEAPAGSSSVRGDCNDTNAAINPDAEEVCNGFDDDCDASIDALDDSLTDGGTFYEDVDGDTFGDAATAVTACGRPAGYVARAGDCDDTDSAVNPGATEICNDLDDDCDGSTDDADASTVGKPRWYVDGDGDGIGAGAASYSCVAPEGGVSPGGDCDDTDAAIHPGATEVCDTVDNDCDGLTDTADSGITDADTYYADGDGDLWGDDSSTVLSCHALAGYISRGGDCDDTDDLVNPDAEEVCDGYDDDCDSLVDDDDPTTTDKTAYWTDADGDGFGDESATAEFWCSMPSGISANNADCDDTRPFIKPTAYDTCGNFIDENCDGEDAVCAFF